MTRCRALLAIEALALLGILVWGLARPVAEARGRDEIDYRHLQPFPVAAQQTVTQPIPLQQDQFSGVAIPYQLQGSLPAQIRVLVVDSDGLALIQVVEQLRPSKALAFATVRIDGQRARGAVMLTVQRVDHLGGQLTLGVFPTADSGRPPIVEQPGTTLAVQTLYGAWQPAILKAPVYADRVASVAPPWLPEPLDTALAGLFLLLGLALAVLVAVDRAEPEPSPIMSRELAPADATTGRNRDPRLP